MEKRRSFCCLFLITILLAGGCQKTPPPSEPAPLPEAPAPRYLTEDEARALANEEDLKKIVYFLASEDLKGRMTGSEGLKTALNFAEYRYKQLGYEPRRQSFDTRYGTTDNMLAYLEGKSQNHIVICGHIDHIGNTRSLSRDPYKSGYRVGANDNGSGTAVVFELAEALKPLPQLNYSYLFINFSGEEIGLVGSQYYVRNPVYPLDKVVMVLNFDMVGIPVSNRLIAFNANSVDKFSQYMPPASKNHGLNVISRGSSGGSDHVPFNNKGIPNIFFHTGLDTNYHKVGDTPDKLNYKGMESITQCMFDFILACDKANAEPTRVELQNFPYEAEH